MLSTPNHATNSNRSETRAQEATQHEDDVQSVKSIISLFQANKLDKSNVWSCELIDKLEGLVRNHNAYVRNFKNIGMSLDATMKVYEIRVDSVCNDVRRLGYGISNNEKNSRMNQNNIEECGSECDVNVPNSAPKVRQRRNRRKLHQVNQNIDLMNGRLNVISVPDELLFKLNAISGDLESAARLFTAILPTKNSYLQIISGQKYIENSVPEPVEFHDDFWYEDQDDFFILPFNLPEGLPIRPISSGLSGYRIQNTPLGDENTTDISIEHIEPDDGFEYAFDANNENSIYAPSQTRAYDSNGQISLATSIDQDFNNNFDTDTMDAKNRNTIDEAVENISKGEYSYRAFSNIKYYWAGPSYWKIMHNHNSTSAEATTRTSRGQRRGKKEHEKPTFTGNESDSSDDGFIKTTTRKAKSIRQCQYRRWLPDKLKLPPQFNIPKDLFNSYRFGPSNNLFGPNQTEEEEEEGNYGYGDDDDNNNNELGFENHDDGGTSPVAAQNDAANISETFEIAPQIIEKIPIAFEKRAKVVNMSHLNKITLWSIERQFNHTANNDIRSTIDTGENFELGKATFEKVYKDLYENQRKFMPESEITPGLALFSVLSAVNRERLRIHRKPNEQNDFEIVQLKKIDS